MPQDSAEIGNLQDRLSRVGAGLDEFLKVEHPDAFARQEAGRSPLTPRYQSMASASMLWSVNTSKVLFPMVHT